MEPTPRAPLGRILVVEDDSALAGMLATLLSGEGWDVRLAADGQSGLHQALVERYDVLLLDRTLPVMDGVDVLRRLRARGVLTPALVLTARATVADRVEGLDAGADDYLCKPFDVGELLARVRALSRRHADVADAVTLGTRRVLVTERRVVGDDGHGVDLSPTECALLLVLARRPAQVFSRAQLLEAVFDEAAGDGTVDTYVHYLRRKLGRDAVRTVRNVGYQLGRP